MGSPKCLRTLSVVKFELGERQPGGEFFFSFLNLFFLIFTKNIISVERFTKVDPAALYLGGKLTWHMGAGRTFLGATNFARGPLAVLCLGGKGPPCKICKGGKEPRCKKN